VDHTDPGDADLLESMAAAIPQYTQLLRDLAVHVTTALVAHHRRRDEDDPDGLPHLAMSLNNLSVRVADLGRREEGLAAIEEATGSWQMTSGGGVPSSRPVDATANAVVDGSGGSDGSVNETSFPGCLGGSRNVAKPVAAAAAKCRWTVDTLAVSTVLDIQPRL
jgi:hypothetical protein